MKLLRLLAALAVVTVPALAWIYRAAHEHSGALARAVVPGGDGGGIARAEPAAEQIDPAGLVQAEQAALAEPGFRALVVMRDEHIVRERYGGGLDGASVIDSGGFALALVGVLAGIASRNDALPATVLNGFNPARVRAGIEAAAHLPYALYLSRKLWQPLNAADASIALPAPAAPAPADCCLYARVLDWMRVAGVLAGEGRFEGTLLVPPAWIVRMRQAVSADGRHGFGVELASAATGAEPLAAADAIFLRGPGHWRLWIVPSAHLAVLFGAEPAPDAAAMATWDETRLPNILIRSLTDAPAPADHATPLQRLVPAH